MYILNVKGLTITPLTFDKTASHFGYITYAGRIGSYVQCSYTISSIAIPAL